MSPGPAWWPGKALGAPPPGQQQAAQQPQPTPHDLGVKDGRVLDDFVRFSSPSWSQVTRDLDAIKKVVGTLQQQVGDVSITNPVSAQTRALGSAILDDRKKWEPVVANWNPDGNGYKLVDFHTKELADLYGRTGGLSQQILDASGRLDGARSTLDAAVAINTEQATAIANLKAALADVGSWRLALDKSLWDANSGKFMLLNRRLGALHDLNASQADNFGTLYTATKDLFDRWRTLLDDVATGGSDGVRPQIIPTINADWWKAFVKALEDNKDKIAQDIKDLRDTAGVVRDAVTTI